MPTYARVLESADMLWTIYQATAGTAHLLVRTNLGICYNNYTNHKATASCEKKNNQTNLSSLKYLYHFFNKWKHANDFLMTIVHKLTWVTIVLWRQQLVFVLPCLLQLLTWFHVWDYRYFWPLKDGSLQINDFISSNDSFTCRNVFFQHYVKTG